MEFKSLQPDTTISLFVKNILVFEGLDKNQKTILPFFADGYPGLMFQETPNGLLISPHKKQMPPLFLYGQTIKPIELIIEGPFKLIIFQLYPFVLQSFFNLSARDLNDSCYDLAQINTTSGILPQLLKNSKAEKRIDLISNLLLELFHLKKGNLDLPVRQALEIIINYNGKVTVRDICKKVHLTERTFERRFLKEAGISPKHFSQIIQFQQSLQQITLKDYTKLTDLVYNNGFADQSHFIRVFKAFTGITPKKFATK